MDKDNPKEVAETFFAPELTPGSAVSFSDSRGLSAFAFASGPTAIGVDIEDYSPDRISCRKNKIFRKALSRIQLEQICSRYFPAFLQKELQSLEDTEFQERFFTYWVCTEALIKATGQGLDLNTIQSAVKAVSPSPGTVEWQGASYYLSLFKPYPQCVLALAQAGNSEIELLYENNR